MPLVLLLLAGLLSGCITRRGYPEAHDPRAVLTPDKLVAGRCKLLGIYESTGRTPEEASDYLQVRVFKEGATHLALTSWRPINQNIPARVDWFNETLLYPVDKRSTVATGKAYACKP